jgi:5'-3' exonuclease
MGIPSYFSYIVKNHASIIRKFNKSSLKVNNLYLDANSIIYDCVHKIDFSNLVESDSETIQGDVFRKIDEYIALLNPDSNVYIAFDGVAPTAKLEQQRQRRYKSKVQADLAKAVYNGKKADAWNTAAITPGTKFMASLNTGLRKRFNDPAKYNLKNLILSPSDRYGEGEHKLFEYIRAFPDQHKEQNTVIYGLDADLIMLAINHLPVSKNLYLFRETPHFIQSISSDLQPNETYLMDIPELAKALVLEMNPNPLLKKWSKTNETDNDTNKEPSVATVLAPPFPKVDLDNRMYDYIFLCFFLGNDFMPHFPSVNIRTGGVDKMLNAYKATIGSTNENLTNGKQIYWGNVRKLVQHLANLEEEHIKTESALRDKRERIRIPDETPEDKIKKFDALPTYERVIEKYIDPKTPNWQSRYYKSLFEIDIDEVRKKQICINYLEGLEWTMKYYTSGCPDWRWCYHYNYPPLFSDLLKYVPFFETEFVDNKKPAPVSELTQLSYVSPKESLSLLPPKLHERLNQTNWYRNDCDVVWAYCRYFWEAHVLLPEIDIDELEGIVSTFHKVH